MKPPAYGKVTHDDGEMVAKSYSVAALERWKTKAFNRFEVAVYMAQLEENPRREQDAHWADLWWAAAHEFDMLLNPVNHTMLN